MKPIKTIINEILYGGPKQAPQLTASQYLAGKLTQPIKANQDAVNRLLQHYEKLQRIRMTAIKEADFCAKRRAEILINKCTERLNSLSENTPQPKWN